MTYSRIRKVLLAGFIGFLMLTALVGIVSVLSGEFGELQIKILATCLTISVASIFAMACAAFIERRRHRMLGLSGITLSIVAASLIILGLWEEVDSEVYWKSTLTLGVFAAAFAHGFLLLLPQLADRHRWVQSLAQVCTGVLAIQIVAAAWGEIEDVSYYRALAVVAILVGLETLVIPILVKFGQYRQQQDEQLVLRRIEDGLYEHASGKRYRVTEINADP